MKTKSILIALAALAATSASAMDFHGYARTGLGGSASGGKQQCFQAPNTDYKFRLGNECETYIETQFDQSMYKDQSGLEFKFSTMLALIGGQAQDFETLRTDNSPYDIALRQVWVGAVLPQMNNAMFWIGKRYFQRQDAHIIDFFYWDPSGPGAGLEDISLGFMKGAVSVFQSRQIVTTPANAPAGGGAVTPATTTVPDRQIWRADFRVYGLPIATFGSLMLGVNLNIDSSPSSTNPSQDRQEISPQFNVQHSINALGGRNKLTFQYGTGSAATLNQFPQFDNSSDSKQWRIVEDLVVNPNDKVSAAVVGTYADYTERFGGTDISSSAKQWGVGARPIYHFSALLSLAVDLGYQSVEAKNGTDTDARTLLKVAPAFIVHPAPGPGGAFFTRPELRLFVTYASWNDAAQRSGIFNQTACTTGTGDSATGPFGCDKNGLTFGVQAETWF